MAIRQRIISLRILYSLVRAILAASMRLLAPSLLMASER